MASLASNPVIEVLLIIEAEIATTDLMEQIVGACSDYGISYRKCLLDKLQPSDLSAGVIPFFVRCGDPLAWRWARALRNAGYIYAYYIDDNFWRIAGDSLLAHYYRHPIVRRSLEFCVGHADTVITNSEELARFLTPLNSKIAVLPSFFDFSLVEGAGALASSGEEIRVGFAGSPSRADDLELLAPVIPHVLERNADVVFEFVGAFPKGLSEGPRVRFFPHLGSYKSYIEFQVARGWRVGLAPLIDHEANRAKTDNKYREYAAFRCAGIYSNIPPYRDVVRDGETGLLIDNASDAWIEAICHLAGSADRCRAISEAAFADAKARYDLANVSCRWAEFFLSLTPQMPLSPAAIGPERLAQDRRAALIERWRLHVGVVRREGGWPLVVRKAGRRVFKLALARLGRLRG